MRKVAVLQSNYLPWKGYFDIINDVDLFIFYDEVQYTHNDWRNRNKLKSRDGIQWLSIPVGRNLDKSINQIEISNKFWQRKHWHSIVANYSKSPYFKKYRDFFEQFYMEREWKNLSILNQHLIRSISQEILKISTTFEDSSCYQTTGKGHEKLLDLLKKTNASIYVSGPAAQNYVVQEDYRKANIEIIWKKYEGYPIYKQNYGPFEHQVSIIDLIFNVGDEAPYYIWEWRNERKNNQV